MWIWLIGMALAGKWDAAQPDVIAAKVIDRSAEEMFTQMADLQAFAEIVPESCASDWQWSGQTAGRGAKARELELMPVDEALRRILAGVAPTQFELVALADARDRVLAEP